MFLGAERNESGDVRFLLAEINPPAILPVPESVLGPLHLVVSSEPPWGYEPNAKSAAEDLAAVSI